MNKTSQTLLTLHNLAGWPKKSSPMAEELRKTLPSVVNAHIDRFKKRGRTPIALLRSDGVCQGCYIRNSAAILQSFNEEENAAFCEHCGRLLLVSAESSVSSSGITTAMTV